MLSKRASKRPNRSAMAGNPGRGRERASDIDADFDPDQTIPRLTVPSQSAIALTRFLGNDGPVLSGISADRTKIVWTLALPKSWHVASDPVLRADGVAVVVLAEPMEDETRLYLATVDPQSGIVLSQQVLTQVAKSWRGRSMAEVVPMETGFLIHLGGLVIATEADGVSIRWVRTIVTAAAEVDRIGVHQYTQRPLVENGQIILLTPGDVGLECLDAATGQRVWRYDGATIVRMLGQVGPTLICQSLDGLVWVNQADGKPTREFRWPVEIDSVTVTDAGQLVILDRVPHWKENNKRIARLSWVDLTTGRRERTTPVAVLGDNERLGPLMTLGGDACLVRTENWQQDGLTFVSLDTADGSFDPPTEAASGAGENLATLQVGDPTLDAAELDEVLLRTPLVGLQAVEPNAIAISLEAAYCDPLMLPALENVGPYFATQAGLPWRVTSLSGGTLATEFEKPLADDAAAIQANQVAPLVLETKSTPHAVTGLVMKYRNRTDHVWDVRVSIDGRLTEPGKLSRSDDVKTVTVSLAEIGERNDNAPAVVVIRPHDNSEPRDLEIVSLTWE